MSAKRVLHVVGAMNRGGAETMLMALYRVLDKNEVQFDFLELSPGESDYAPEIRAMGGRVLKTNWSQSVTSWNDTTNGLSALLVREGPFVAVHSHVLFASGTVLFAAARAGVAVRVAHSHNTSSQGRGVVTGMYRWLARWMIWSYATDLMACTVDAGNYLFGTRKFERKGIVIPNAVDVGKFYPATEIELKRLMPLVGLHPGQLNIVSVARLEPVKNHEFLLEVALELDDRGTDFCMVFVGDGSLRSALESRVREQGLANRVQFWGVREDIVEIMRCSDVLVMPSHFEGLPVTLIEAQATGIPCLVSENVTKDVDMGLGIVKHLPTNSPSVWSDALTSTLPTIPNRAKIARCLAGRGYTVEGALKKLLRHYPLSSPSAK